MYLLSLESCASLPNNPQFYDLVYPCESDNEHVGQILSGFEFWNSSSFKSFLYKRGRSFGKDVKTQYSSVVLFGHLFGSR